MTPEEKKVFEDAIETFGQSRQKLKLLEELAELTVAMCKHDETLRDKKFKRKEKKAMENVIEEIADVSIMLDQMLLIYDDEEASNFKAMRKAKVERLKNRIAERKKK